jgi:putative ABC transport system permease protein
MSTFEHGYTESRRPHVPSNETVTPSEPKVEQSLGAPFAEVEAVGPRLIGAILFVLLFAISALMLKSICERTPELMTLKAVGFSLTHVMLLILSESLVLCIAGAAIGLFVGTKLLLLARTQIASISMPPGLY